MGICFMILLDEALSTTSIHEMEQLNIGCIHAQHYGHIGILFEGNTKRAIGLKLHRYWGSLVGTCIACIIMVGKLSNCNLQYILIFEGWNVCNITLMKSVT